MKQRRDIGRRGEGVWCLSSIMRPEGLRRFLNSYKTQGEDALVELHLWREDPEAEAYAALELPENWEVRQWPDKQWLPEAMNRTYMQNREARFYGLLSDDMELHGAYTEPLGRAAGLGRIAFGDDGCWGERLSTHFVIGGDLVRAVGWFAHPKLRHSCIDNVWHTLGASLGTMVWCPEVKFKHWNPYFDDSVAMDSVNIRAKSAERGDKQEFQTWARDDSGVLADLAKAWLAQRKLGMWRQIDAPAGG